MIARLEQPVHIRGKLVSRAHLPGQTQQYAVDRFLVDGLPAGNHRTDAVRIGPSLRDPECIGNGSIDREQAAGTKEPEFVLLDRTAQRHINVAVRTDPVNGFNAMR